MVRVAFPHSLRDRKSGPKAIMASEISMKIICIFIHSLIWLTKNKSDHRKTTTTTTTITKQINPIL